MNKIYKWLIIFHSGAAEAILQHLPAVRELKKSTPDCLLAWVTDEFSVDLVMDTGVADKVIVHPVGWRKRGLVAWIRSMVYTKDALRKLEPSLVFNYGNRFDFWMLAQIIHLGRHFGRKKGK